jgi:hypothetical protein
VTADRRQQANLDVATPTATAEDRIGTGLLTAHRIDSDVAAAAGELSNSGRDIGAVGTQRVFRAQGGGSSKGRRVPSATTTRPPSARAIITVLSPTPPAPTTVTHSPSLTRARPTSAR